MEENNLFEKGKKLIIHGCEYEIFESKGNRLSAFPLDEKDFLKKDEYEGSFHMIKNIQFKITYIHSTKGRMTLIKK